MSCARRGWEYKMGCEHGMVWMRNGSFRSRAYRYAETERDYFSCCWRGKTRRMTLRRPASLLSTGSRPKTRCGDGPVVMMLMLLVLLRGWGDVVELAMGLGQLAWSGARRCVAGQLANNPDREVERGRRLGRRAIFSQPTSRGIQGSKEKRAAPAVKRPRCLVLGVEKKQLAGSVCVTRQDQCLLTPRKEGGWLHR